MSVASRRGLEVARFVLLAVLLVLFLFPFYWLVKTSLEPSQLIYEETVLIPTEITFEHYWSVVDVGFIDNVINSMVVGVGTLVLTTVVALLGAYAVTRHVFPGRQTAAKLVLLAYMFPNTALIVPLFGTAASVGLLSNPIVLVLLHSMLALPFCMWILQSYLESIPLELEEAAMVEGASKFGAFRRVMVPQAAPAIIAVAILAFIISWGEYMFAYVLMTQSEAHTVPVAIMQLLGGYQIDWGRLAAASVVAVLPVLAMFWLMVKYLGRGIARGTGVIDQ